MRTISCKLSAEDFHAGDHSENAESVHAEELFRGYAESLQEICREIMQGIPHARHPEGAAESLRACHRAISSGSWVVGLSFLSLLSLSFFCLPWVGCFFAVLLSQKTQQPSNPTTQQPNNPTTPQPHNPSNRIDLARRNARSDEIRAPCCRVLNTLHGKQMHEI